MKATICIQFDGDDICTFDAGMLSAMDHSDVRSILASLVDNAFKVKQVNGKVGLIMKYDDTDCGITYSLNDPKFDPKDDHSRIAGAISQGGISIVLNRYDDLLKEVCK